MPMPTGIITPEVGDVQLPAPYITLFDFFIVLYIHSINQYKIQLEIY
jgi:hypothetical protein